MTTKRTLGEDATGITHHNEGRIGFSAEASDLGLAPGIWPDVIEYEGIEYNRKPLDFSRGDAYWMDYDNGEGFLFRVYND